MVRLLVGRTAEGREAVAALYEIAPAFLLDDASMPPRVTRVFETEAAQPRTARGHARHPPRARRDRTGPLRISADRPAHGIDLACSSTTPPSFSPIAVTTRDGAFRFKLPTLAAHRCYAIARDADGLPLGRLGSGALPISVVPPPPPPGPSAALHALVVVDGRRGRSRSGDRGRRRGDAGPEGAARRGRDREAPAVIFSW